jgi:hypothetical protein
MRKTGICFLMLAMFFCLPFSASSSCLDCAGGYEIDNNTAIDSISAALSSETGEELINIVEDMGGEIDVTGVRGVRLPQAEVFIIPAGENEASQLNIVYIDKGEPGPFFGVMESPKEIFNLLNTFNIYLPSGDVISFDGLGTANTSDIKPSANWTYCLFYAICDYLLSYPIDVACYYFLYLCFF